MHVQSKLEEYKSLVNFLGEFLGEDTEVVLHDTTDWHRSIVAIANGHISGRKVGSPMTDYAMEVMKEGIKDSESNFSSYKGKTASGHELKSATYYIKDDDQIVGMLCINQDISKLREARNTIDKIMNSLDETSSSPVKENFNIDVKDLVRNHIETMYSTRSELKKLSKEQKTDLVKRLDELGTFMVKGAVTYVAELLGVSVSTIYRYLGTVKNNASE